MQAAALVIVCAFALWIAAAGVVALARPVVAREWIGRFATSHAVSFAEQAWRGLAGAALILRGPVSLSPALFAIAGWIMVISAAALAIVPLRWHAGYAKFWSRHLPLPLVRLAGVAGLLAALGLAASAVGRSVFWR